MIDEELHHRLSGIVGCGSPSGLAEIDQVEMILEHYHALLQVLHHYHLHHDLPDVCCPDLESAMQYLRNVRKEEGRLGVLPSPIMLLPASEGRVIAIMSLSPFKWEYR